MKKASMARLLLLSALLITMFALPRAGYAYELCPSLSCADYTYLCVNEWGGTASFSWARTLCYDDNYYLWEYNVGHCTTGVNMECWGPPS
jgi:hypothetical protein